MSLRSSEEISASVTEACGEISKMIEEGTKTRKSRESVLDPEMDLIPIFLFLCKSKFNCIEKMKGINQKIT